MEKKQENIIESANSWMKNSVTLKLVSVSLLVLFLLIPTTMIKSLISEREAKQNEAVNEVSAKWANAQNVYGPILTVPFEKEETINNKYVKVKQFAHFLPEDLIINGNVASKNLKRGIYEVVVYDSDLKFEGRFLEAKIADMTGIETILWEEAFLTIGISDMRGVKENIDFKWNNSSLNVNPGSKIPEIIYSGITIPLKKQLLEVKNESKFSFNINLQGSKHLDFVPLGKTTDVNITSNWQSPSFNGAFLPDSREIIDSGFTANWKVLQLNRNFPQHWINNTVSTDLRAASFGVKLLLPLDDYQKSMRSAKYAAMTIGLTFLMFFLVEILNNTRIHAFQYILVGLALCLFYTLLISISEHLNFNTAYLISTSVIIGMISFYAKSILRKNRLIMILMATLMAVYGFVFVTLQLEGYALLLGSSGLTLILGMTMYFTRRINWFSIGLPKSMETIKH